MHYLVDNKSKYSSSVAILSWTPEEGSFWPKR